MSRLRLSRPLTNVSVEKIFTSGTRSLVWSTIAFNEWSLMLIFSAALCRAFALEIFVSLLELSRAATSYWTIAWVTLQAAIEFMNISAVSAEITDAPSLL